jgi:hypothetical protein
MQMISLLAALSISMILTSQMIATWSTPLDSASSKQETAMLRATIRALKAMAITTKTTQVIQMPITQRPMQIRSFSGNQLEAYSDGSVSPGQVRLCGKIVDWLVTVSSLGRTHVIREPLDQALDSTSQRIKD